MSKKQNRKAVKEVSETLEAVESVAVLENETPETVKAETVKKGGIKKDWSGIAEKTLTDSEMKNNEVIKAVKKVYEEKTPLNILGSRTKKRGGKDITIFYAELPETALLYSVLSDEHYSLYAKNTANQYLVLNENVFDSKTQTLKTVQIGKDNFLTDHSTTRIQKLWGFKPLDIVNA